MGIFSPAFGGGKDTAKANFLPKLISVSVNAGSYSGTVSSSYTVTSAAAEMTLEYTEIGCTGEELAPAVTVTLNDSEPDSGDDSSVPDDRRTAPSAPPSC